jgi:ferredoxin-NADP reductase
MHTRNLFTSWVYLWVTVGVYGSSIVFRTFMSSLWLIRTTKACITVLPDTAASVRIKCPDLTGRWSPGQHAFLRFPTLNIFENHPFTIASIEQDGELQFIIKQRTGLTNNLYRRVTRLGGEWNTTVIIDGPYGGPERDPGSFDTVVLVAGGVGVTFTLPILKDLVRRAQEQAKLRCSKFLFVWTVRGEDSLEWILSDLEMCVTAEKAFQAELYVTGGPSKKPREPSLTDTLPQQISVDYRRPALPKILSEAAEMEGRMCVFGAGPEGLMATLSSAVADLQKKVMEGHGVREIYMHVETFGG